MFEYVERKEYEPVKKEIERIIREVQKKVRYVVDGRTFTFQFELVGSGKQKLVTKEADGNRGFDFDYNLIINNDKHRWKAARARETLLQAFQEVLKNSKYKVENSASVITIKYVDTENSKIIYSCDFALMRHYKEKYYFIKKNSEAAYIWNERNTELVTEKSQWVKAYHWKEFKGEYLKLKNKQKDRNSFSLRLEAINNICNKYGYCSKEAESSDGNE